MEETLVKNGFPPSVDERCTRLILGSMPGEESLRQQEYYAHPRNAFWPIMGSLFGFDPAQTAYGERLAILLRHGIALWDSVGSCTRRGSLDSNIKVVEPNDFTAFFRRYPRIHAVYFNGNGAFNFFKRFNRNLTIEGLNMTVMPSTSPAYAVLNFVQKRQKWSILSADELLQ